MERLAALARSKLARAALALIVVAAAVVVGLDLTSGTSTYPLKAVYASAPGLFPGAAVDVLGVPVGTVTSVTNVVDHVDVGMQVKSGTRIPAGALASLVAPEVLGQPDVDLNPGYTGGAYLHAGTTIPQSRTSVPVSTDQLLKQLRRTLNALNPHAVGSLVTNLAQDLDGQGSSLNSLIHNAAGTIQLLANKGDDLGQLNGTLAQLTGTLDSETSQIEQLVSEYDTVSTILGDHSSQLNDAITQLTGATTALVTLLTPNLKPLEADVGVVTTAGRTLDRNLSNVDEILAQGNSLFQGAQRVFSPTYNWLDLNVVIPPGVDGDYVVGLIRDRLSGVCRRILANHGSGLTAAVTADLTSCGNPNSSFFDPLINEIPTILNTLTGGSASASATALIQEGLTTIGNLTGGTVPPVVTPESKTNGPTSSGAPTTSTPTPTTTPAPTTTTTTPTSKSSCNDLSKLLGCPAGLLSKKGGSSSSSSVRLASSSATSKGPSLTAPAATMLPPLSGSSHSSHSHHAHRGLVGRWL
jgi:phospholipid/cholesterol/gamma-HCH transport system substrate-binding protein